MGKSISRIYLEQNKSLHKAFTLAGLPYEENREYWLERIESEIGRKVAGVSKLTLQERRDLISGFQVDFNRLNNPFFPAKYRDWVKGDKNINNVSAERPLNVPDYKQTFINKIKALLTDQGKAWTYADSISRRMFKIDFVEHCSNEQLYKIVQALSIFKQRHGSRRPDMRHMSFSITTSQIENKTKRVTRRLGWKDLKPGELLQAVEKCMGLKKGEKHIKICVIRVLDIRPEPLTTEYVTKDECIMEGFPEKTPEQFIEMFCKYNGCKVGDSVNRIEFEYI